MTFDRMKQIAELSTAYMLEDRCDVDDVRRQHTCENVDQLAGEDAELFCIMNMMVSRGMSHAENDAAASAVTRMVFAYMEKARARFQRGEISLRDLKNQACDLIDVAFGDTATDHEVEEW